MDSGEGSSQNHLRHQNDRVVLQRKVRSKNYGRLVSGNKVARFTVEFRRKFSELRKPSTQGYFESKLLELLHYYREESCGIASREITRIMRSGLPTLIYERQVKDSNLVSEFLVCIDNLQGDGRSSIDLFLMSALNRGESPTLGDSDSPQPQNASSSYLAFYLHHAREKRMTFRGQRLTKVFSESHRNTSLTTLLYSKPKSVLTLLQYEARFFGEEDSWNDKCQLLLASAFEFIVFCGVTTSLWSSSLVPRVSQSSFPPYIRDMMLNFRILLRTVPNPHLATLRLSGYDVGPNTIQLPFAEQLKAFFAETYPDLDLVSSRTSSLQHSCRMVIRRRLNDNWQLPDGIYKLGLPPLIANYVNILEE